MNVLDLASAIAKREPVDSLLAYRPLDTGMMGSFYLESSCSLMDDKSHGSDVTHWISGTPSSKSLATAAEKLHACAVNDTQTNGDGRDLLLEEQRFISGIRLDVLLERLVLHERVIRPDNR
jgi:hypothetical protein